MKYQVMAEVVWDDATYTSWVNDATTSVSQAAGAFRPLEPMARIRDFGWRDRGGFAPCATRCG